MYKKIFFANFLLMPAFFFFSISLRIQDLTFYEYYLANEKCFTRYFEVNTLNYGVWLIVVYGSNTTMIA